MLQGLSHKAESFGGCEYGFSRVRAIIIFFLLYHVSGNLLILSHLFGRQLLLSLVAHLHFVNPHCWESRRGVGATPPSLAPSTPPQAPSLLLTLRAGRWGAAPRQRLGKAVKAFGGAQTQAGEPPSPPFCLAHPV